MTEQRSTYETAEDGPDTVVWFSHGGTTGLVRHVQTLQPGEHSDRFVELSTDLRDAYAVRDEHALCVLVDQAQAMERSGELTVREYAALLTQLEQAALALSAPAPTERAPGYVQPYPPYGEDYVRPYGGGRGR
jgi:hypothetical protein